MSTTSVSPNPEPLILTERQLASKKQYLATAEDYFGHVLDNNDFRHLAETPQKLTEVLQAMKQKFMDRLNEQDFSAVFTKTGHGAQRGMNGLPQPEVYMLHQEKFHDQEVKFFQKTVQQAYNEVAGDLQKAASAGLSWTEKLGARSHELFDRAGRNMFSGSTASQIVRGTGVGLGAAYTIGGVSKLFSPKRQVVAEDGTAQTPPPSKMGALLQIAAGTGVVAASLFLKGKNPGASSGLSA